MIHQHEIAPAVSVKFLNDFFRKKYIAHTQDIANKTINTYVNILPSSLSERSKFTNNTVIHTTPQMTNEHHNRVTRSAGLLITCIINVNNSFHPISNLSNVCLIIPWLISLKNIIKISARLSTFFSRYEPVSSHTLDVDTLSNV